MRVLINKRSYGYLNILRIKFHEILKYLCISIIRWIRYLISKKDVCVIKFLKKKKKDQMLRSGPRAKIVVSQSRGRRLS